jgi:hypothetical protein
MNTVSQIWEKLFLPDFRKHYLELELIEFVYHFQGCSNRLWSWSTAAFIEKAECAERSNLRLEKELLTNVLLFTSKGWQVPPSWFKMSTNERNAFLSLKWNIYKPQPKLVMLNPTEYGISQGYQDVYCIYADGIKLWKEYQEQGLDSLFYYSEI